MTLNRIPLEGDDGAPVRPVSGRDEPASFDLEPEDDE